MELVETFDLMFRHKFIEGSAFVNRSDAFHEHLCIRTHFKYVSHSFEYTIVTCDATYHHFTRLEQGKLFCRGLCKGTIFFLVAVGSLGHKSGV